jgi:magnesium-transporting ATPase (P-type)
MSSDNVKQSLVGNNDSSSESETIISTFYQDPIKENGPVALTFEEAEILQEKYGKNQVLYEKPLPWWMLFLIVLVHPFNVLLFFLAVISGITTSTGYYVTMSIMLLMIILSTGLRFFQEIRAEQAAQALKKMVSKMRVFSKRKIFKTLSLLGGYHRYSTK